MPHHTLPCTITLSYATPSCTILALYPVSPHPIPSLWFLGGPTHNHTHTPSSPMPVHPGGPHCCTRLVHMSVSPEVRLHEKNKLYILSLQLDTCGLPTHPLPRRREVSVFVRTVRCESRVN